MIIILWNISFLENKMMHLRSIVRYRNVLSTSMRTLHGYTPMISSRSTTVNVNQHLVAQKPMTFRRFLTTNVDPLKKDNTSRRRTFLFLPKKKAFSYFQM